MSSTSVGDEGKDFVNNDGRRWAGGRCGELFTVTMGGRWGWTYPPYSFAVYHNTL